HYFGWEETDDEWVKLDDIREAPKNKEYKAGSSVEIEWNKKWYPAIVIKTANGLHYVHYKDYDDSWNEWAGPARIRTSK
ncbi:MAG TPA: agenet domain-containing protein, partial [Candidatus Wallbacteria bacterium]|nr:agenet domain-containing protein [Candidatus Wallbacteria bacterium]